jgi:AcrR family transcriptional regulator
MAARLSRETIVRTALEVLDEAGLEGLTVRALGERLGVRAGALYWHVRDKRALLDEMATVMLGDLVAETSPAPETADWLEYLTGSARALRRALLAHRDGAKVFSGTYLTDDALLESMETPLRVLTTAGFSLADAVLGWQTVYSYVVGFVIEEQAVRPSPGETDPRYELDRRAGRIDPERFPLSHAAGPEGFADPEDRFARGLDLITAGMARHIE